MPKALILDFDGSILLPETAERLDLRSYEERVRYYARFGDIEKLKSDIEDVVPRYRTFFCGSGDFHHISYLLLQLLPYQNLHVVVLDNHPDNMYFPAAIHCGSWVYHASKLPNVSNITVVGITSGDMRGLSLLQNRFSALRSGKVKYYCLCPVSKTASMLSNNGIKHIDPSVNSAVRILEDIVDEGRPVYLSVDKDVLAQDEIVTTWDQGLMKQSELLKCIRALSKNIIGADIVGDLSICNYRSLLKRFVRRLDGEETSGVTKEEQLRHADLNIKLLSMLNA